MQWFTNSESDDITWDAIASLSCNNDLSSTHDTDPLPPIVIKPDYVIHLSNVSPMKSTSRLQTGLPRHITYRVTGLRVITTWFDEECDVIIGDTEVTQRGGGGFVVGSILSAVRSHCVFGKIVVVWRGRVGRYDWWCLPLEYKIDQWNHWLQYHTWNSFCLLCGKTSVHIEIPYSVR